MKISLAFRRTWRLALMLGVLACADSSATDIISTVAGNGNAGFSGDGGPATNAMVDQAWGVAMDSSGSILIADTNNNRIRKVVAGGIIITIAGNGAAGFSGDGGAATAASLNAPRGVSADPFGNIYIADTGNNRIRCINAQTGRICTVAGNGSAGYSGDGGPALGSSLNAPTHAMSSGFGFLAIADSGNHRVRCVGTGGSIYTLAGDGVAGYSGDGGPGASASLNYPSHVAWDNAGNVLFSDRENHRIRRIDLATGIVTTAAGNGTAGSGGDGGLAIGANLFRPFSITVDAAGNYFIADSDNARIRRVSIKDGKINTVAGNGQGGFNGDGNNAKAAKLNNPVDVITDQYGTFYIADLLNYRVRGVNTDGAPAVYAGTDKCVNTQALQDATVSNAASMEWRMIGGPPGGQLLFGSPASEDTTISATLDGVYIARLIATGANDTVAYDDIIFTWDTTAPAIHADIVQEAISSSGNVIEFIAAADALDPNAVVNADHASGETFPIGTTIVHVSASDLAGNAVTGSFNIVITDSTAPVLSDIPADIVTEATSPDGAVVNYPPATATDVGTPNPAIAYSQDSGTVFALGTTVVTVTATDAENNATSATFNVTVLDTTAPVLSVPADMTVDSTGPTGGIVNYPPASATDLVTLNPAITYSQDSGTFFPLGYTTVVVNATDDSGNSTSGSFTIRVIDPAAPLVDAGTDKCANAAMFQDATVTNGGVTFQWTQQSGPAGGTLTFSSPTTEDTFISADVEGVYVARLTACSQDGVSAYDEMTFTWDVTPPAISLAADNVTAEAAGPDGAVVAYSPATATDASPVVSMVYSQDSGTLFPLGVTPVTVTATDAAGNSASVTFTVTVQDTTPPVLGPDVTVEATGAGGATVNFVGATDLVDLNPAIDANPPSGSLFPLGQTIVLVTATDSSGNSVNGSFLITVVDTTDPAFDSLPPDQVAEATSPAGAVVDFPPATAHDSVTANPAITYSQESGTTFPLGMTVVTVTATDNAGNAIQAAFTVTVQDTTPPAIGADDGSILNGNLTAEATSAQGAVVDFVGATDLADPNPSILANPPSGSLFPIGVTIVNVTATDASGNSATGSFTVTVVDTTGPELTSIPSDISVEATTPTGINVNYPPASASDLTSTPSIAYSNPSGSFFPLGQTAVTVTAADNYGNSTSATFNVTVTPDVTPPVIIAPSNVTSESTGNSGANVTYPPADSGDAVSTTYDHPSGSFFPVGTTVVTVTAKDGSGNTSSATFTVTVVDTHAPVIQSGPTANPSPGVVGEPVSFTVVATDAQPLTYTWDFGDGTVQTETTGNVTHVFTVSSSYPVTVTVTDAGGLSTPAGITLDVNNAETNEPVRRAKLPMLVTRLIGGAMFSKTGADRYSIAGFIPNTSKTFDPLGKTLVLDVGGAISTFKLDAKGRAKSASGRLMLKLKYKRNKTTKKKEFVGGAIPFTARLSKGSWVSVWQNSGVNPALSVKKGQITMIVDMTLDETVYTSGPNCRYDAKAQKAGRFRYIYRKPRK